MSSATAVPLSTGVRCFTPSTASINFVFSDLHEASDVGGLHRRLSSGLLIRSRLSTPSIQSSTARDKAERLEAGGSRATPLEREIPKLEASHSNSAVQPFNAATPVQLHNVR